MARSQLRDLRLLLRGAVLADAVLAGLVGSRVYGRSLIDSELQTTLGSGPVVTIEFLSGGARWHGQVASQTFDWWAMSKESLDQASEVYDAIFQALHHSRIAKTGVPVCGVIFEVQRPVDGFNDTHRAWFVRGRWQANTASDA